MRHYCVIGGTGFIGSRIVRVLHAPKNQLTVIGREPIPTRPLPEGVRYAAGDYGDAGFLAEILQGVDGVINLAYSTVPKTSFEDPVQDIFGNLPAAVRFFETAGRFPLKKIVLVSSGGTVYGKAQTVPITEDHPTNPISPYGITKLAIEKYALMYKELTGLPVVVVRPANAYGEGQRPFAGQGFVATAVVSILENREIALFGESGTIRDYIHVNDVASGIIAALEHGETGACYNIGSGTGRSNRDILDAIFPLAEAAGFKLRVKTLPPRQFDVPVNILDCSKLSQKTGWKAVIPFEDGIERTWNWFFREHNKI